MINAPVVAVPRQADHICNLASEIDIEAVLGRVHLDLIDKTSQDGECLVTHSRVLQRLLELRHLAPIDLGEVGMK